MPNNNNEEEEKPKWKAGWECVPGSVKTENEITYLCNKRGKWKPQIKKTIEAGIARLFPNLSK